MELPDDAEFEGVRYQNENLIGEQYLSDSTSIAWADGFEADYGAEPRITEIIASVSSATSAGDDGEEGGERVDTQEASVIAVPAEASLPAGALEESVALLPKMMEHSRDRALGAQEISAQAAAATWQPAYSENGAWNADSDHARFYGFYSWSGNASPMSIDGNFGLEFEYNLYSKTGESNGIRPTCYSTPGDSDTIVVDYKDRFWAKNYDWSWQAYTNSGGISTTKAYADINDLSDECARQSIAVGIQAPYGLSDGSDFADFGFVITAPHGTHASDGVGSLIQAVERVSCEGNNMAATDCMGIDGSVKMSSGDTTPAYQILNSARGWTVPESCWTTLAGSVDGPLDCTPLKG